MARSMSKGFAQLSGKHVLVDKANSTVIISAAIAAAVVVFGIFASIALVNKISYQNKVIGLQQDAKKQLEDNLDAKDELVTQYLAFDSTAESVIGTADKNSKIVLDALPSKYDFPALATSLDSIITGSGLSVDSITGVDQELEAEQSSISPTSVTIPFEISASGNYESVQKLVTDLGRSIRPFKILSIQIQAKDDSALTVTISGETYYQPSKDIGIQEFKVNEEGEFVKSSISTEGNSTSNEN